MNILVLGNGFDIAHELKTSYRNFLESVEISHHIGTYDKEKLVSTWGKYDKLQVPNVLCNILDQVVKTRTKQTVMFKRFYNKFYSNFWFKYFKNKPDGTWIDFERDIQEVCEEIEEVIYNNGVIKDVNENCDFSDLDNIRKYIKISENIRTYKDLVEKLGKDLEELINSFDYYIENFINKTECNLISEEIVKLDIDKVLSFNYSNTYHRLYNVRNNVEYVYIHGKAGAERKKEYSNLVLGYMPKKNDTHVELIHLFAIFKKYYQRVLKGTGNQYTKWVNQIKCNEKIRHNVYFFGHSLDVTDSDIIRALILNKNVTTTIFFHSEENKIKLLKNLIVVLGDEKFIEYTNSNNIIFKKQDEFKNKDYISEYKHKITVKNVYNLPYIKSREYNNVLEWISQAENNFKYGYYPIKYVFMVIDALKKYNVLNIETDNLINQCKSNAIERLDYDTFKNEYLKYCNEETKDELEVIKNIVNDVYLSISEDKFDYKRFLRKINYDGRKAKAIYMGKEYLKLGEQKMEEILNCFFDSFDNVEANQELYRDMALFLTKVEKAISDKALYNFKESKDINTIKYIRLGILEQEYEKVKMKSCRK